MDMQRYTKKDASGRWMITAAGQKAADRLAAYENTGFAPYEFYKAFDVESIIKLCAQELGVTPDRIRCLAEADNEGRVVMFDRPRKPLIWGDAYRDTVLCPECGEDLMGGYEIDGTDEPMYQCPHCGCPITGKAITKEEMEKKL